MLSCRLSSWIERVSAHSIWRADGNSIALPRELACLTKFSRGWHSCAELIASGLPEWQLERLCLAGILEVGAGDYCMPLRARRYYEEQFQSQATRRTLSKWMKGPLPRTMWIGLPHCNLAMLAHSTAVGLAEILSIANSETVAVLGVLPDLSPLPRTAASLHNLVGLSENLGIRLGVIGGDHLATWSLLNAVKSVHSDIRVQYIHIDAHHDLYGYRSSGTADQLNHANFLADLLQRGCVDRAVLVGCRDRAEPLQHAVADGLPVSQEKIAAWRPTDWTETAHTHLSIDVDVLDPRFAPAVSSPIEGGWTVRALTTAVEQIVATTKVDSCSVVECGGGDPGTIDAALAVIEALGK